MNLDSFFPACQFRVRQLIDRAIIIQSKLTANHIGAVPAGSEDFRPGNAAKIGQNFLMLR